MVGKYFVIKHKQTGILFFFAWDDADPSMLHIYARHLMRPF